MGVIIILLAVLLMLTDIAIKYDNKSYYAHM